MNGVSSNFEPKPKRPFWHPRTRLEEERRERNPRSWVLMAFALSGLAVGLVKAGHMQLVNNDTLQDRGALRLERDQVLSAQRGKILDRKGDELASNIVTAGVSIIGNQFRSAPERLERVAKELKIPAAEVQQKQKQVLSDALGMSLGELDKKLTGSTTNLVYLKRQVELDRGRQVQALLKQYRIQGVQVTEEYRRYYPAGETTAQLLGYVNLSGEPLDGLEVGFNEQLAGTDGSRRVMRTGVGNVVEHLNNADPALHGADVKLTLDNNLQYLAYAEVKAAVLAHNAKGGSAVMLDATTGEILALANYPSYDPNKPLGKYPTDMRNRAVTDPFEPGSTIKPFTMSLALEKGIVNNNTVFTGEPFKVGRLLVNDGDHPHARMTLSEVMQFSSNIGTVKMALQLSKQDFHAWLSAVGIGQPTKVGIKGTSAGKLRGPERWQEVDRATFSYGYGLSATLLQLARAYTVFTNHGELLPLSLVKQDTPPVGVRVMRPAVADALRGYLERVTEPAGTGNKAQVANFTTAGKTGTARKATDGSYKQVKYIASFVGFAPASKPRVIVAVMIDEPSGKEFFGGQVAAPVFSNIVSSAMRALNVQPDMPNRPVINAPFIQEAM